MKRPKPVMKDGKIIYPNNENYTKRQLERKLKKELSRQKPSKSHINIYECGLSDTHPLNVLLMNERGERIKKWREQKRKGPQQRQSTKHKTHSDCHPHFRKCGNYLLYFDGTIRNSKTYEIIDDPTLNEEGYATLGGKLVHRMMSKAWFINPNPDEFTQVNHIDKNRCNNNIENLELVDHHNNILHRDGKPYYAAPRYYTECKFT
jgi:hypothetical protein